jgi:hypothetical protein
MHVFYQGLIDTKDTLGTDKCWQLSLIEICSDYRYRE